MRNVITEKHKYATDWASSTSPTLIFSPSFILFSSPPDLNSNQSWVTIYSQRSHYDFASNAVSPECPLQRNRLGIPREVWPPVGVWKSKRLKLVSASPTKVLPKRSAKTRHLVIKGKPQYLLWSPLIIELQKQLLGTRTPPWMSAHDFDIFSYANSFSDRKC